MMINPASYLLAFSRIVTGFVFALSGFAKLRNFQAFEQAISNFRVLPKNFEKPSAFLVILGELTVVLGMLLGGGFLLPAFWLAFLLLLVFSIALLTVLFRKLQTSCNCFGVSDKAVSGFDVVRNLGFMICALAGWLSLPNAQANLETFKCILLGLMAITFSVMWIKLGDLAELFL